MNINNNNYNNVNIIKNNILKNYKYLINNQIYV